MKMKHAFQSLILLCTLTGLSPSASAQVQGPPAFVDYQGTIYDANGKPYGSAGTAPGFIAAPENKTMEFRVYNVASGGTDSNVIWAETQTVTVSLGQFSVRLGSGAQITAPTTLPHGSLAEAFDGKERFLELTVINPGETPSPILPRLAFQSSPFSFVAGRAKVADEVIGKVTATAGSTFSNGTFSNGTFTGGTFTGGSFTGDGAGLTNVNGSHIQSETINMAALVAAVKNALCPPGTICAYGGTTPPTGWKLCNGESLSRTLHNDLYLVIGTSFGAPDGDSFNVPDLRGMFLRGCTDSRGDSYADPDKASRLASAAGGNVGNMVGSVQDQQFKSHDHIPDDTRFKYLSGFTGNNTPGTMDNSTDELDLKKPVEIKANGGLETRPNNIYVNYIIKL